MKSFCRSPRRLPVSQSAVPATPRASVRRPSATPPAACVAARASALASLALAALLAVIPAKSVAASGAEGAQSAGGTGQQGLIIEDGQAQIVPAFADSSTWIRQELWVETSFDSDGDDRPDRVHVAVTRPGQTVDGSLRVPVIYETSPYYSGVAGINFDHFWDIRQEVGGEPRQRDPFPPTIAHIASQPRISRSHVATWVPRGFAVVHSQSPGTGQSQGCPTVGGENESLAPKAVIDWLNGRARGFTTLDGDEEVRAGWATGRVGMTGTSYNGTLPLAAATTGVEGLEAIIPIAPNTSYYHYYRSNGLVRSPGGYPGEDADVLFDFIFSGFPEVRDYCLTEVREAMTAQQDRITGDYNDFWAGRDYLNHIDGVRAATLMSHGFNDWNVMPEHSHRISMALRERGVPLQIFYHQGGHGGPPPLELMNKWFTRYVVGAENGVENDPEAWIVREGNDPGQPTPYPSYPHPEAEPAALHPAGDGRWTGTLSLDAHAAGQAVAGRASGPGSDAGEPRTAGPNGGPGRIVDNFSFGGDELAAAEWSTHRLLYATEELAEPVHLSGVTTVRVRVAADAAAANLSVWLVSLPWTEGGRINDNLITRGWADPTNAGADDISAPRTGTPLTPGEFVEVEFDLQPDDQIIPAGARIGLMIFSSDRDFTLHPDPGTTLTVDPAGTRIELPVVGGAEALRRALRVPAS